MPVLAGVRGTGATADIAVSANGTVIYAPANFSLSSSATVEPVWVTRTGVTTPIDTAWTVGIPSSGTGDARKRLALSPDGHRLSLSILRGGSGVQHDIWVKQLDHAPLTLTRLTFEGNNASPAWTQDGRAVVFASEGSMRSGSVGRRHADGTGDVDTLLKVQRGINYVVITHDTTQFVLGRAGHPPVTSCAGTGAIPSALP